MQGYWDNAEASAEALRNGWLHTGDIGVFDAFGYLSLKDRSKDMIISGGVNIYPQEIEDALPKNNYGKVLKTELRESLKQNPAAKT